MAVKWVKENRVKATAIGTAIVAVLVAVLAGDDVTAILGTLGDQLGGLFGQ